MFIFSLQPKYFADYRLVFFARSSARPACKVLRVGIQ